MLSSPVVASAMTVDDIVGIPPVSDHYVQKTLDRVNAGIARANSMTTSGDPIYSIFKPWWIYYVTSAMLSTADTRIQLTSMQRDLFESTPCLHLDVIILQSKIEKVRQQLHLALEARQPYRVMLLQHLVRFLNRRVEHLLKGARDPLYEDTDWGRVQWFDPVNPVWCCPEGIPGNTCVNIAESICNEQSGILFNTPRACQEYGCVLPPESDPLDGRLCPFHSDYLPASSTGFGCDADALPEEASDHPPTKAEMEALADIIAKREVVSRDMESFITLITTLDAMAGTPTNYEDLRTSSSHHEMYGCTDQITKNQRFGTGTFLQDIGSGSLLQGLLVGAYEARGPFSIPKNEPWIAVRYTQLLQQWGVRRPQAKYLRYPGEFPPGLDRTIAEENLRKKPVIVHAYEWFMRMYFSSWNVYHGNKAAVPVAKSQDAQLQIAEVLRSAHGPVERLGNLVSGHSSGLRYFTKSFAYYLRRSCLYRSCNRKLEQILRIVFKNQCFPYFSGTYFGDMEAHTACKNAANISVSP